MFGLRYHKYRTSDAPRANFEAFKMNLDYCFIEECNKLIKEKKLNREKKEEMIKQMINVEKSYGRTITTSDNLGNSISTTVAGMAFIPLSPAESALKAANACELTYIPIQENKKMRIAQNDPHHTAREHLIERAYSASSDKEMELEHHFHIRDTDTSNWSYEDFVKSIKNDMFEYRDEKKSKEKGVFNFYNSARMFRFRDPNKPADRDGFKVAYDKVQSSLNSVIDSIIVDEPTKARKEVDKFRETTFH